MYISHKLPYKQQ